MNSAPILIQPDIVTLRPVLQDIRSFSSAATIRAHLYDCVWRAQAAAKIAARTIDANRKHAHFLSTPTATGTRRARTCHLHQLVRQAQMTQLQYYPQTQIRQGADRDRTLRVDHLSLQTRIASITVTAHAAPKIATNNRSPCDTPAASSRTYFESAPTAGDSNRRSRLAITQLAGRVMADTIVAKKAGPDTKVAITPVQFYLFPASCRSARIPLTVRAALPTGSK